MTHMSEGIQLHTHRLAVYAIVYRVGGMPRWHQPVYALTYARARRRARQLQRRTGIAYRVRRATVVYQTLTLALGGPPLAM